MPAPQYRKSFGLPPRLQNAAKSGGLYGPGPSFPPRDSGTLSGHSTLAVFLYFHEAFRETRSPTTMKLPSPSPIGMTSEWAREFFEPFLFFTLARFCGRGKVRVLRVFHKHTP